MPSATAASAWSSRITCSFRIGRAARPSDFFLRLRDREEEVPAHVQTVAKITGVDIERLMGRFPRSLSGGEKQRVSIARAFARDLELLLFDEPFANLDAKFRGQARVELKRLIQEFKVTLVYVTHDQVEAMSIADRIVVLNAGRIVQAGTYQDLHDNPDSLFVAEFLGTPTINAFWGRVQDGEWDGSYMGKAALPSPRPNGAEVIVGIRPKHIHLCDEGAGIPAINRPRDSLLCGEVSAAGSLAKKAALAYPGRAGRRSQPRRYRALPTGLDARAIL